MTNQNKKGFTIIEVVLVLAIAGLIFLMVFIALPALQRSQRNTQRENDISRFLTAVNDYQTNNSGKTPFDKNTTKLGTFTKRYIDQSCTAADEKWGTKYTNCGAQFTDPNGEVYVWGSLTTASSNDKDKALAAINSVTDVDNKIYVVDNAGCGSTEGTYTYTSGSRNIAFFYVEEGGAILCNDNH